MHLKLFGKPQDSEVETFPCHIITLILPTVESVFYTVMEKEERWRDMIHYQNWDYIQIVYTYFMRECAFIESVLFCKYIYI